MRNLPSAIVIAGILVATAISRNYWLLILAGIFLAFWKMEDLETRNSNNHKLLMAKLSLMDAETNYYKKMVESLE